MRIAFRTLCFCFMACAFWCATASAEDKVEVKVTGLTEELENNVLAYLSIADLGEKKGAEASQPVTESNVRRLHGAARAEIERALKPFGYYEPTIRSQLQHVEMDWIARSISARAAPCKRRTLLSVTGCDASAPFSPRSAILK